MKRLRSIIVVLLVVAIVASVFLIGRKPHAEALTWQKEEAPAVTGKPLKLKTPVKQIPSFGSESERLAAMELIATEQGNELWFDSSTADIALVTKNGTWFSTPWNLAEDNRSVQTQKQRIASQLHLTYLDSAQKVNHIYSFDECVIKGQYTAEPLKNGVQVNMILGRAEQRRLLPGALPQQRFNDLVEQLDGRAPRRLKAFYKLYDPEKTSESQLEMIRDRFPIVDKEPIYVLKKITDREMNELEGYFKDAGYTLDDMDKDLEAVGASVVEKASPRFEISVCYQLIDGELVVTVPSSLIHYDEKYFTLLNIGTLEYLAAADCKEDGYILYPDGCGAVLGFNRTGSKLGNDLSVPVYGYDRSLNFNAGYENLMTASVPVFGVKAEKKTLFAVIDGGDAVADILANTGGVSSGYAHAGVSFRYTDYDSFEYKDTNTQYSWTLADKHVFDGNFRVCYKALEADSGYGKMAEYYSDRLQLKPLNKTNTNLTVGLFGSVKHTDSFLFVPVEKQVALTTFDDALEAVGKLQKQGVSSMDVRYLGWSSDGLNRVSNASSSVRGKIGGKSGAAQLTEQLKSKGDSRFFENELTYVDTTKGAVNFSAKADTCRMLNKTYSGYTKTLFSSGLTDPDKFMYAVNPRVMLASYSGFEKKYTALKTNGLSLGSFGTSLNSDKSKSNGLNRSESKRYICEILSRADKKNDLMVAGANAYCYPYVSRLLDVPSVASGYPDADYAVPFLQMILHGRVDYSAGAVNLSGNYQNAVLNAIETGSDLYFEIAYRNAKVLKSTAFSDYYSVDYNTWEKPIVSAYKQVDEAIGDLKSATMTDYKVLTEGVSAVTYSTGDVIYVNYNSTDYTADGITVPAGGYYRVKAGGSAVQ
ncbi:MAG: DUF5696 domain-containing protein [Clostridia bacterium]|nr:DUF5696 domain-containing protein [Clostridia bacterium]